MYYYKEELISIIKPDKPDPAAAGNIGRTFWRNAYDDAVFFSKLKFQGKTETIP